MSFVAVVGGIMVTQGRLPLAMCRPLFNMPNSSPNRSPSLANIANIIQSTMASAERIFELLDEQEEIPRRLMRRSLSIRRAQSSSSMSRLAIKKMSPLMEDMNIDVKPGQTIADCWSDRRRQDDAGQPADAFLRSQRRRNTG